MGIATEQTYKFYSTLSKKVAGKEGTVSNLRLSALLRGTMLKAHGLLIAVIKLGTFGSLALSISQLHINLK